MALAARIRFRDFYKRFLAADSKADVLVAVAADAVEAAAVVLVAAPREQAAFSDNKETRKLFDLRTGRLASLFIWCARHGTNTLGPAC